MLRIVSILPNEPADAGVPEVLASAWRRLILEGRLIHGEPGFRYGVRLEAGEPQEFAELPDGSLGVGEQRRLAGVKLLARFSPARAAKPGTPRVLAPGPLHLPVFDDPGMPCAFLESTPEAASSICRRPVLLRLQGRRLWSVVANLWPYEPWGTFLVLPTARDGTFPHERQHLGPEDVEDFVMLARRIPGHAVLFNGPHAGASVNHLHLQLVRVRASLPIESVTVQTAGDGWGRLEGAAQGLTFDLERPGAAGLLREAVECLQHGRPNFNLLVIGTRGWLFCRDRAREVVEGFDGVVAGWELGGVAVFSRWSSYEQADGSRINAALRETTLAPDFLIKCLSVGDRPGGC